MSARVPLDVDLEDKLMYGLTPARLAYLVIALGAGFTMWSSQWAPTAVRGIAAAVVIAFGAGAAWGRWRGRAADEWAVDAAIFVAANRRIRRSCDLRWPIPRVRPPLLRFAARDAAHAPGGDPLADAV